jgi:hypothetical protein
LLSEATAKKALHINIKKQYNLVEISTRIYRRGGKTN